jgi:AraC family transcriptional regulator
MSTCHFARLFRRQYNVLPHEFLLNLRINEAKKHLLVTDLSIETIAEKCGFNSASHFIRAFGQRVGITPTQFRKQKF